MALPPSKLKEVIESLADDFSMKGRAIPGMLKKQGVKDEELKFAKLGLPEPNSQEGMEAWNKDMLKKAEANRSDKQDVISIKGELDTDYGAINIRNPNADYEERVYTFQPKEVEANFRSEHFPATTKNYLAHTRIQPMDLNGKKVRTILELQSDLHAQNRANEGLDVELKEEIDSIKNMPVEEYAKTKGWGKENLPKNIEDLRAEEILAKEKQINKVAKVNAPYSEDATKKLLERELFNAVEEGAEYSAIPISGKGLKNLHRSEPIQAMYEKQVKDTAIKLAKQQGLDYRIETKGTNPDIYINEFNILADKVKKGDVNSALATYDLAKFAHKHELDDLYQTIMSVSRGVNKPEDLFSMFPEVASQLRRNKSQDEYLVIHHPITQQGIPAQDLELLVDKIAKEPKNFEALGSLAIMADKNPKGVDLANLARKYSRGEITEQEFRANSSKVIPQLAGKSGTKLNFNLYATPGATAGAAYLAFREGYSQDEVAQYLVEKEHYSEEEAKDFAAKTKEAIDAGYTEEEAIKYFDSKEVTTPEQAEMKRSPAPTEAFVKPITSEQAAQMAHPTATLDHKYYDNVYRATTDIAKNAKELVASQEVLTPAMISSMQQAKSFIGYDNKTNQLVEEKEKLQKQQIVDFAAQQGYQVEYDPSTVGWRVMTDKGWQEANPSMWADLQKSKGEIAAGLTGSVLGAKYGFRAGIAAFPEASPISGPAGGILGMLGGGLVGSVVGNESDYIFEAMNKHAELDAANQVRRMTNAAQSSLLYDIIGGVAMKTPSAIKATLDTMSNVKTKVTNAISSNEAVERALSDTMFLNKDESADLVRVMERFGEVPGKTELDKRVAAAIYTQPGSEGIASAAAKINPIASRTVARNIDLRAQDLLKTSENLTSDNLPRLVTQDLKNYEDDVKNFYTEVKMKAATAPNAANYTFDLDKLAIDPILEKLQKNIDDPRVMEKFLLQVGRVRNITTSRDFNDLLELRKVVNDFKYNSKITSAKDFEQVNAVVKNIDSAITNGAQKVVPDADKWLDDFKTANYQYAQMMGIKKNVLYKALTKPGIDYDKTVSALTRYITAEDSTFLDVTQKLPMHTRAKVEGSVINSLAEKYTAGVEGGERAVSFPQLGNALEKMTFTTPEARKFKLAVQDMAEVFKNDVPLAAATGSLRPPSEMGLLNPNLLNAAKRAFAMKIFNFGMKAISSDSTKLIYKAAQVLENPLNSKSMTELMKDLDGAVNIEAEVKAMTSAAAQEKSELGIIGSPKVKLYGNGDILKLKGEGSERKVALHRIASIEEAAKIAEAQGINRANTQLIDAALREQGYEAIQYGADKVRLLK